MRKRMYVFGANGMMGKYFCSLTSARTEITRDDYDILLNDQKLLEAILKGKGLLQGDIIVNLAGAIKQRNFSLKDYVMINSTFPHMLEDIAQKNNCKLVHITTDCVYDGKSGTYTEDRPHTCTDWYGMSKSLGEPQSSCCIRTSIIGLGSADNVSLLDWFMHEDKEEISGFANHWWNGLTCLELSRYILNLIETDALWQGVRHVSSNIVSKYELLKIFNNTFKLNKNLKLEKGEYDKAVYRTLSSKFHDKIDKDIKTQIKELKEHHDENGSVLSTVHE